MKNTMLSALAMCAALVVIPAQAQQGPFPALMNALTGNSGAAPAATQPRWRAVPQPQFAQPRYAEPRYAQPRYAPRATYRAAPQRLPDATRVYRAEPSRVVRPDTRSAAIYRRDPATDTRPVRVATAPARQMDPRYLPTVVPYDGGQAPGTIVIDTDNKYLYLVQSDGTARRYGVGVGRPGFEWAGTHKVTRKAEWPDWRPPAEMRKRQPGLPAHMEGGPNNPLGARALYLGSTLYRIHGSNQPWTIGQAVSSGCIRMRNEDVIDLYNRVGVGTKVIVS